MLRTAFGLGLGNIARVLWYRLRLRVGLHPAQHLSDPPPSTAPYFRPPLPPVPGVVAPSGLPKPFGWMPRDAPTTAPPWHTHLVTGAVMPDTGRPWWRVPDFDPAVGDIKAVWERSRWDWALALAQQARQGNHDALTRLDTWLDDWTRHNPPYRGPNWKCGQETSLRVLHVAMASLVLGGPPLATPALRALVRMHLRRVAPTMGYAVGQANNHGTSEAAALFVGGSWLLAHEPEDREAGTWLAAGRRWLEDRARTLILPDGTFSQYSVNYHRVMLDTYSIAETWRRRLDLPAFTADLDQRLRAATEWLFGMVDAASGDAPNIGANDGAHLLRIADPGFRDYRPSVQLASTLWTGRSAYDAHGPWNTVLTWLGLPIPDARLPAPTSTLHDDGGFARLRYGNALAVLRYPRFRFRPSHADPLHIDLTVAGENVLRDAGSLSYAADEATQHQFAGIAGHTTVQFDGREPMRRRGRFLWDDWLTTEHVDPLVQSPEGVRFGAGYRDAAGAHHVRQVELGSHALRVTDAVAGFQREAVWRWRLRPGSWWLDGLTARSGDHTIVVHSEGPVVRCALVIGRESRWYLREDPAPVLEVVTTIPGTVVTTYRWGGPAAPI